MAKITCSYSGVVFNCEHMPISLSSREIAHPLFFTPKKRLISLAGQWAANRLSPTESYLLYLALLNSTELIVWRTPAIYGEKTPAVIANNMEYLIHIIGKIDLISHPSFALPSFAISYDTAELTNSYHWIQAWITNYNDWYEGYKTASRNESLKHAIESRETALEKLIKSPQSNQLKLAKLISDWAETAGAFPKSATLHPITNRYVPLSEYWKQIIIACINEDKIWYFPEADILELIDHCEDNIAHGSIYAYQLMSTLKTGIKNQNNYLGYGDTDLMGETTQFRILDPSASVEDVNKIAIIQSAPEFEPNQGQYKSKFEYIKAKLKWEMAQKYKKH